jgi:hypothetical protein
MKISKQQWQEWASKYAQNSAEDVADAERFRWLIKQGLAWRDCYDKDWLQGEWLYEAQDARSVVDAKRVAAMPNEKS